MHKMIKIRNLSVHEIKLFCISDRNNDQDKKFLEGVIRFLEFYGAGADKILDHLFVADHEIVVQYLNLFLKAALSKKQVDPRIINLVLKFSPKKYNLIFRQKMSIYSNLTTLSHEYIRARLANENHHYCAN